MYFSLMDIPISLGISKKVVLFLVRLHQEIKRTRPFDLIRLSFYRILTNKMDFCDVQVITFGSCVCNSINISH
jgi:hypothetical protein